MTEQKLRAMMQRSAEEPSEGFDERIAFQLMNLTRKEEPRMKRSASIIVVFALVLALGMSTALAAFNDDANQLLYQFWPQAAMALRPVNLISESQGIRMEVVSATLNGTESLVMLTMQEHIGLDRGIKLRMLTAEGVYLHTVEHVLRLILPS